MHAHLYYARPAFGWEVILLVTDTYLVATALVAMPEVFSVCYRFTNESRHFQETSAPMVAA
jgi:hypothetical protein